MKEAFGIAALVISVAANIPYAVDIVKGRADPHRISWFIWTVLGGVYFFSTIFESGATLFTIGELIGPVAIFILSLKYGVGGHDRKNQLSLLVAMVALGLLFVLDGVIVSLVLALIVDAIAISITVRKVLLDRDSESKAFWALGAIAALFAIASLEEFVIAGLLYPVYALSVSLYIFLISEKDVLKPKSLGGRGIRKK
jgi:hypothetical protein